MKTKNVITRNSPITPVLGSRTDIADLSPMDETVLQLLKPAAVLACHLIKYLAVSAVVLD